MSIFFKGQPGKQLNEGKPDIPLPIRHNLDDPAGYFADPALTDAVDVALILGQPLLLTGEPGTGKTLLAYAIGKEFGYKTHKFETKSTSTARDLFYLYDTVGRFQAKQIGDREVMPVDYINYNALGKAILLTKKRDDVSAFLPPPTENRGDGISSDNRDFQDGDEWQQRSIVLIDEVDKAPRDFPNDILNEIEGMYFKIPELGNKSLKADDEMRPIVIITSNSEKHLPDAFLRRCVFYNIDFPDEVTMKDIVERRVGKHIAGSKEFLNKVVSLFYELRESRTGLQKKPSTAELLGWIIALKAVSKDQDNPINRKNEKNILNSLSVLIKNSEDITQAKKAVTRWLQKN